jgi:hypothetical protein
MPTALETFNGPRAFLFMGELLTVRQVSEELKVCEASVTRWFGDLPGVLDFGTPELVRRHKRRKRCLRIPRAVLDRFLLDHRIAA